jgi:uncharacterized Fe-S cluster protein YjdI
MLIFPVYGLLNDDICSLAQSCVSGRLMKSTFGKEKLISSPNLRQYYNVCVEGEPPLWSSGQSSWLQNGDVLCFL